MDWVSIRFNKSNKNQHEINHIISYITTVIIIVKYLWRTCRKNCRKNKIVDILLSSNHTKIKNDDFMNNFN